MANQLPRVDLPGVVVDPINNTNPKFYLNVNDNAASQIIPVGFGPAGGNISNTVEFTRPSTAVAGTVTTTFTLSGYPEYSYDVDIVILPEGVSPPANGCLLRPGPYIYVPNLMAIMHEDGHISYRQHIIQNGVVPDNYAIGTDGRVCTDDISENGDEVDNSLVNNFDIELTIENEPDFAQFEYEATVVASADDIPTADFTLEVPGEVAVGSGPGMFYDIEALPGQDGAAPVGKMPDGTLVEDAEGYSINFAGTVDFDVPGTYMMSAAIEGPDGVIMTTCKSYRMVVKMPQGSLPRIEAEGMVVSSDRKTADICMDIGQQGDTITWGAYYADGSSAKEDLVFTPNDFSTAEAGMFTVNVSLPASGDDEPGIDMDVNIHVGMEACNKSKASPACGGGDDEERLLNYPTDYFGHFDYPTPLRTLCQPEEVGLEPGDDVPNTIFWAEDYETNFHNTARVTPEIIEKHQKNFYHFVNSIMVATPDNNAKFTDLLNRIRDVPRVYESELLHRGMSVLVPDTFPVYWPFLLDLLIRASDDDERMVISEDTDFSTLLEGAPETTVDFLTQYFAAMVPIIVR